MTILKHEMIKGYRPLILVAMIGHTQRVQALIKVGADVNAKETDGLTPLMLELLRGMKKVLIL